MGGYYARLRRRFRFAITTIWAPCRSCPTPHNVRSLRRTRLPPLLDRAIRVQHRLVDAGAGAGLARLSPDRLAIPPRLRRVRELRAVADLHAAGGRARRSPRPNANVSRVANHAGVVGA